VPSGQWEYFLSDPPSSLQPAKILVRQSVREVGESSGCKLGPREVKGLETVPDREPVVDPEEWPEAVDLIFQSRSLEAGECE